MQAVILPAEVGAIMKFILQKNRSSKLAATVSER